MNRPRVLTQHDPQKVGALLRGMRISAGITQDVVAQHLGLDRTSVNKMERGKHTASLANIMQWAKVCGFDIRVSIRKAK